MDRQYSIGLATLVALVVLYTGGLALYRVQAARAAAPDHSCPTCHTARLSSTTSSPVIGASTVRRQAEGAEEIPSITADHSQFEILQQDFADATAVTEACLTCHNQADEQFHATVHWQWEFEHPQTGQLLGKQHVINNSVLSVADNLAYCATCHTGYGLSGPDFDFTTANNIDCLSCHDTTGEYEKLPGAAGNPAYEPTEYPPGSGNVWQPPDLSIIAQNVGSTSRASCGSCHFNEQNVSPTIHGQLPVELLDPDPSLDVHMASEGVNFSCTTCHEPNNHDFFASRYWPVTMREDVPEHLVHATCSSCHNPELVHANETLNQHSDRIACQTCHIPNYGRASPTLTSWDWSTAGRLDDQGNPIVERNAAGLLVYDSRYGSFEWGEQITPDYVWFNGIITFTKVGDTIDPQQLVPINRLEGSYADPQSKLWPVSRFRGVQPYDSLSNHLVAVDLYGDEPSAYWESFDWEAAIAAGMEYEGIGFSGEYGFVATERFWLLNHMVAPADEALGCGTCHSRDGRLADVGGAYIPGRDRSLPLDIFGGLLVGGALVGVVIHGTLRFVAYRRRSGD